MYSTASIILLAICLSNSALQCKGKNVKFLGVDEALLNRISSGSLLAESERLDHRLQHLGTDKYEEVVRGRAEQFEAALEPMFRLAPKDRNDFVDVKAARYLLHRFFVKRHSWHVNGLHERGGDVRSSSIAGDALSQGHGFSLRDLAHFAATVETLIHAENLERMQFAFDALGFSREQIRSDDAVEKVLEAYFVIFLASSEQKPWTSLRNFSQERSMVLASFPTFADVMQDAGAVTRGFVESGVGAETDLWSFCLKVAEQVAESFGQGHNKDCADLKSTLMELETPGTGRVPLHAFWAGVLKSDAPWYFYESEAYLKQLGALYTEEGSVNSVIIPNYLYSSANCASGTQYYELCCSNECEELLGKIEGRIGAASASPELIADTLARVSSSTVSAPRQLPATLLNRLQETGEKHGNGKVPLHGRLFAQVLHHAYPRECPFPQPVGSALANATESERIFQGSRAAVVSVDAASACMAKATSDAGSLEFSSDLPWSDEEELLLHSVWVDGEAATHETLAGLAAALLLPVAAVVAALRSRWSKLCGPGEAKRASVFV